MTSLQPSFGWAGPAPIDIIVTNRAGAAIAVGDVLVLDVYQTDGDSTNNNTGSSAAGLANVIKVVTAKQPYAIYGVCQKGAADNGLSMLRLAGTCDVVSVAGAVSLGATASVLVAPATGTTTLQVVAQGSTLDTSSATAKPTKNLFIPLTSTGGAGTTNGWFNGIHGFGSVLLIPN